MAGGRRKKNNSFPPLKVNKQRKHCHSHANGPCRRQIFFALSYLIHTSPRQSSERRLCSNPPLLIPPSLHPSLLHPSPLPLAYYLSSGGPLLSCSLHLRIKKSQSSQSGNFGHFQATVYPNLFYWSWRWKIRMHFLPTTDKYLPNLTRLNGQYSVTLSPCLISSHLGAVGTVAV